MSHELEGEKSGFLRVTCFFSCADIGAVQCNMGSWLAWVVGGDRRWLEQGPQASPNHQSKRNSFINWKNHLDMYFCMFFCGIVCLSFF